MSDPILAVALPIDISAMDTAKPLAEVFQPYDLVLSTWKEKADALKVTSVHQVEAMKLARQARLEIKEARVAMEKTRKSMVEGLKKRTGAIDEVARAIRLKMELYEEELRESEEFAERKAIQDKAELKKERELELQPFMESPIAIDLSELADADYARVLADARLMHQHRAERAKAEAEAAAAKAEAERLEQERIKTENAKLNEQLRVEREKQRLETEKRVAEEQERNRLEAARRAEEEKERTRLAYEATQARNKLREKEEAEAQVIRERQAEIAREEAERMDAAQKAAETSDTDKLRTLIQQLQAIQVPDLQNSATAAAIKVQISKFEVWIESLITKL
jgi:hypothetical protein